MEKEYYESHKDALDGADLCLKDLQSIDLSHASLRKALMRSAVMKGSSLRGALLAEADMRNIDLSCSDLQGADLRGANLRGANLSECNIAGADLSRADLRGANLSGSTFQHAVLEDTILRKAVLDKTDFRCAMLSGADLRNAALSCSSFESAVLVRSNLKTTVLQEVNFSKANLQDARLFGASLKKSNLRDACLRGADLNEADLQEADLQGAVLEGTGLCGCNLFRANISQTQGVLDPARWLEEVFERDEHGIIVYRAVGDTEYDPPESWKMGPGIFLEEVVNFDRGTMGGCGVSFATLEWCRKNYPHIPHWKCRLRWTDLPSVVIPYNTDGRGRCARLELLEEMHRTDSPGVRDSAGPEAPGRAFIIIDTGVFLRDPLLKGPGFRILADWLSSREDILCVPQVVYHEVLKKTKGARCATGKGSGAGAAVDQCEAALTAWLNNVGALISEAPDDTASPCGIFENSYSHKDYLLWKHIKAYAAQGERQVLFITDLSDALVDFNGAFHSCLVSELHQEGIEPGRIRTFRSMMQCVKEYLLPRLMVPEDRVLSMEQCGCSRVNLQDLLIEKACEHITTVNPAKTGMEECGKSAFLQRIKEIVQITPVETRLLKSGEILLEAEALAKGEIRCLPHDAAETIQEPLVWEIDLHVLLTLDEEYTRITSEEIRSDVEIFDFISGTSTYSMKMSSQIQEILSTLCSNSNRSAPSVPEKYGRSLTRLLNQKDSHNETLLYYTIRGGLKEAVEMLLNIGARVNVKNGYGDTPLHLSSSCGNEEIVRLILDRKPDMNSRNNNGLTPLHYAVFSRDRRIPELLVSEGAEVDVQDLEGRSPLHYAVDLSDSDMAKALIAACQDLELKDIFDCTALDRAITLNNREMAELIESYYERDRSEKIMTAVAVSSGESTVKDSPSRTHSTVFFSPLIDGASPDAQVNALEKIYTACPLQGFFDKGDFVGIKIHVGEKESTTAIRPELIQYLTERIREKGGLPFLVETSTLYKGKRENAVKHLIHAHKKGFSVENTGAPFIMADGLTGSSTFDVPINGELYKSVKIAGELRHTQSLCVVAHATGHLLTGMAGALKTLGMGCTGRIGKMIQHSGNTPRIEEKNCKGCRKCLKYCPCDAIVEVDGRCRIIKEKCICCGECVALCPNDAIAYTWGKARTGIFQKGLAEHALGVVKGKAGKCFFITLLTDMTKQCDCSLKEPEKLMPDLGIIASTDPVAIDKATLDLTERLCGKSLACMAFENVNPLVQIEHGARIGLGNPDYEIVKLT
ncbi:MAG: pentapeptide repeat-containing protein [Candidatus Xenobiia bacterium LiM19]